MDLRDLGTRFVEDWQARNPDGTVTHRDLNASSILYMDNDWIAGVYATPEVERTPEMQKALAFSTELIAELQAADVLFISTRMFVYAGKGRCIATPSEPVRLGRNGGRSGP